MCRNAVPKVVDRVIAWRRCGDHKLYSATPPKTSAAAITRPITFGSQFDTSRAEARVFKNKPSRAGVHAESLKWPRYRVNGHQVDRRSYVYAESEQNAIARLQERFVKDGITVKSIHVEHGEFVIGSEDRTLPNP